MNEYPNIFVSEKQYERLSECICFKKNYTNMIWTYICIGKYLNIRIFALPWCGTQSASDSFYLLCFTHIWTERQAWTAFQMFRWFQFYTLMRQPKNWWNSVEVFMYFSEVLTEMEDSSEQTKPPLFAICLHILSSLYVYMCHRNKACVVLYWRRHRTKHPDSGRYWLLETFVVQVNEEYQMYLS